MPWSNPFAEVILAGAANLRGRPDRSLSLLDAAQAGFQSADMPLYGAAALRHRGELLGGDQGNALIAAADARMIAEQIRNPERMAAMLAPWKLSR